MVLKLYNTRTRTKEEFTPLSSDNVRMYVCGPTVYDYAHIGNARPIIIFDVLFRLLRHVYGDDHVTYARNITDVDDKINTRAAEQYPDMALNEAIRKVTEGTAAQFHADVAALGCLPPTHEPRATETIAEMIALIEKLIERGHAYAADGHVLFEVSSMSDYGQLARRSLEEMRAGARVEVAPYKRDAMDFVLWKPSSEEEPGWDSPWGRGRPGWHIECSAMSAKFLGETFDIHGGGVDLVFPHHENEVAQSRCAHGTEIMANVWMHNGFLQVEGQKMSKSLGNFVTINELLTGWKGYAWPGEALRFNMLRTQYRQPIDWTFDALDETHKTLWDWYGALGDVQPADAPPAAFVEALCDDLNTPQAIAELHKLYAAKDYAGLLAALRLAGFSGRREALARQTVGEGDDAALALDADTVETLIAARIAARKAKNWAEADRIRDELVAMGIVLMDAKDPETGEIVTTWEVAR
ncbi:MAG: cysteine--tRNA ligase [Alphaproteobacteria bacterium]